MLDERPERFIRRYGGFMSMGMQTSQKAYIRFLSQWFGKASDRRFQPFRGNLQRWARSDVPSVHTPALNDSVRARQASTLNNSNGCVS